MLNFGGMLRSFGKKLSRSKSTHSKAWIDKRSYDRYIRKAQSDMFRSRAAYKLLEIDSRFSIFRTGQTVVDLGCFAGGWSQVVTFLKKSTFILAYDSVVLYFSEEN